MSIFPVEFELKDMDVVVLVVAILTIGFYGGIKYQQSQVCISASITQPNTNEEDR